LGLNNNDIIKKLRVALKLRDDDIIRILKHVGYEISKTELSAFFRSEDHTNFKPLKDQILRNFLNGLVIEKRGRMDRPNEKDPKVAGTKPKAAAPKKTSIEKHGAKRVVRFKKSAED
jgi:hypothetical protein